MNDQGSLSLRDISDVGVRVNVDLALTFAKEILNGSKILLIESDLLPELTSSNSGISSGRVQEPLWNLSCSSPSEMFKVESSFLTRFELAADERQFTVALWYGFSIYRRFLS